MNILEEFWYGNIEPTEYDTSPNKEYKETLQLIRRNEEKLLATMTDAQKDLFSRYQDCVREFQTMAECLLFQNSFRLGARMMLEIKGHEYDEVRDCCLGWDITDYGMGAFASTAASLSTDTAGGIPSIPQKDRVLAAM